MDDKPTHKLKTIKNPKVIGIFKYNHHSMQLGKPAVSQKDQYDSKRAKSIHIISDGTQKKGTTPVMIEEIGTKANTKSSKFASFFERKTVQNNKKPKADYLLKYSFNMNKVGSKATSKADTELAANTLERFLSKKSILKEQEKIDSQRLEALKTLKTELQLLADNLNNNAFFGNDLIALNIYSSILKKITKSSNFMIEEETTKPLNKRKSIKGDKTVLNPTEQERQNIDAKKKKIRSMLIENSMQIEQSNEKNENREPLMKTLKLLNITQTKVNKLITAKEVGVQTDQVVDLDAIKSAVRNFCSEHIRKNTETSISFDDFLTFLDSSKINVPNMTLECEKLFNLLLESEQKCLIFDNVVGLMKEKGINVGTFSKMALNNIALENDLDMKDKTVKQNIEKFDFDELRAKFYVGREADAKPTPQAQNSNSKSKKRKYYKSQALSRPKKVSTHSEDLSIDLVKLKARCSDDKTPKGFHQEFSDMADEFSLSWRLQLEKEKRIK